MRLKAYVSNFSNKLVHDALPLAVASALGTLILGQITRDTPPLPTAALAANNEMMRLLREEHALLVNIIKQSGRATDAPKADVTVQNPEVNPTENSPPGNRQPPVAKRNERNNKVQNPKKSPAKFLEAQMLAVTPVNRGMPSEPSLKRESANTKSWLDVVLEIPTHLRGAADASMEGALLKNLPPVPIGSGPMDFLRQRDRETIAFVRVRT